jgi:N-acetylneuraminic acid mutarotase
MNEVRSSHAVCALDGHIYAVGGCDYDVYALSSVERYDPATNSWTLVSPMQSARVSHSVCVLDGCMFAAGGVDVDQNDLSSMEKYDPQTDSWSTVAPIQHARYTHAMAVLDGHIYVAGGYGEDEDGDVITLHSVERYDAATDSWSSVADLVRSRNDFGLSVANGRLTAVGGHGEQSVEQYDVATDTWSVVPAMQMPTTRFFSASCAVEGDALAASTHTGRHNAWGCMLRERMKDATPAECKLQDV